MLAGTAIIDITPSHNVWMDGMIRAHQSEGVHDPLFARALVLANSEDRAEASPSSRSTSACLVRSRLTAHVQWWRARRISRRAR